MTCKTLRRRAIALVAAYAVALQGLFAAFVPLAAASAAGVLCSGQPIEAQAPASPSGPPGHEPSCAAACAMLAAAAVPPPPAVVEAALLVRPADAPILIAAARVAAPRGPHTARAPPGV